MTFTQCTIAILVFLCSIEASNAQSPQSGKGAVPPRDEIITWIRSNLTGYDRSGYEYSKDYRANIVVENAGFYIKLESEEYCPVNIGIDWSNICSAELSPKGEVKVFLKVPVEADCIFEYDKKVNNVRLVIDPDMLERMVNAMNDLGSYNTCTNKSLY